MLIETEFGATQAMNGETIMSWVAGQNAGDE